MFVCSTVDIKSTKQKTMKDDGMTQGNTSFFYYLRINGEQIPVFQNMHLNTLGLKRSETRYWLENFQRSNMPSNSTAIENTDNSNVELYQEQAQADVS
ncbi:hypothetical protein AVEN_9603-1 [Araneus ventricosus]|uniref:Uncharacterized protein n=1 Tax=Araneus ventricosus TaxID=182803 RepID=A0A4Y2KFZ4_ARAVE|nr:hypothetical protein AVEN_9603-1 [Araneus ventricosus]